MRPILLPMRSLPGLFRATVVVLWRMGKEAKNPKEHSTLRVRRAVTPAKLAANRANAKLGGRPPGCMSPIKRDLSERCRVKDMRHVEILEVEKISKVKRYPSFVLFSGRAKSRLPPGNPG
jgi:hypothetical protein